MTHPFFIVALPRSRTTWLSAFLTGPNILCYHEATRVCASMDDLALLLATTPRHYAGNCDGFNLAIFDDLVRRFPGAKFVTILRPVPDVRRSLDRVGLPVGEKHLAAMDAALHECAGRSHMALAFDELDDEEAVRALWDELFPNIFFDCARYQLFRDAKIEPTARRIRELPEGVKPWHLESLRQMYQRFAPKEARGG